MRPRYLPGLWVYFEGEGKGGGAGGTDDGGKAADAGGKAAEAGGKAAGQDGKAAEGGKPGEGARPAAPAFDYQAWAEGLTDAQKKDYAKRFKSLDDVLDGSLNLRKDIAGRIKVPGEKATDEEKAAFRKAIGAKDKAEEYKAALPEGYEMGEVQTALLGAMQQAAASEGVPAGAFEQFTKTYFEFEKAVAEKVAEEVDQYRRDTELALKQEYGKDYEKYTRAAKSFIDKLGIPEFTNFLEDSIEWKGVKMQLGSHPAVVKMLTQIGLRTAEDGLIGHTTETERTGLMEELKRLRSEHPFGTAKYTPEVDRKIRELNEKLYG